MVRVWAKIVAAALVAAVVAGTASGAAAAPTLQKLTLVGISKKQNVSVNYADFGYPGLARGTERESLGR